MLKRNENNRFKKNLRDLLFIHSSAMARTLCMQFCGKIDLHKNTNYSGKTEMKY